MDSLHGRRWFKHLPLIERGAYRSIEFAHEETAIGERIGQHRAHVSVERVSRIRSVSSEHNRELRRACAHILCDVNDAACVLRGNRGEFCKREIPKRMRGALESVEVREDGGKGSVGLNFEIKNAGGTRSHCGRERGAGQSKLNINTIRATKRIAQSDDRVSSSVSG